MSGVLDLSPGLFALAATYGSGQHVTGVVVHHPAPEALALDVRVVLSEAQCNVLAAAAAQESEGRVAERSAIMLDIASRIRDAVAAAARDVTRLGLIRVDVFIDDLR